MAGTEVKIVRPDHHGLLSAIWYHLSIDGPDADLFDVGLVLTQEALVDRWAVNATSDLIRRQVRAARCGKTLRIRIAAKLWLRRQLRPVNGQGAR